MTSLLSFKLSQLMHCTAPSVDAYFRKLLVIGTPFQLLRPLSWCLHGHVGYSGGTTFLEPTSSATNFLSIAQFLPNPPVAYCLDKTVLALRNSLLGIEPSSSGTNWFYKHFRPLSHSAKGLSRGRRVKQHLAHDSTLVWVRSNHM